MNKAVKKTFIIIGIVLASLVGLFLLLYFILFLIGCGKYGDARDIRKYVCAIPDLNSGFAPQGVTYAAEIDSYILTGYDSDNTVALYIVKDKAYDRIKLKDEKGKTLKGHAGGVTCTKNNVYIANDYALCMFDLTALKDAAKTKAAVTVKRTIAVDNCAAYCYSDDEFLYVGEFYRDGNYETDKAHHYTTPNKAKNKAIVSCYKLDENGELGTDGVQPYPEYCISVTGLVQGFATKDGTYVLSRSYGLVDSELQYHTAPKDDGATISVKFESNPTAEKKTVPLYYLDDTTNFKTLTLPAFGEDITIVNDRVVHTNEASANKYFVGKLFGANKVYSYPLYKKEVKPNV